MFHRGVNDERKGAGFILRILEESVWSIVK